MPARVDASARALIEQHGTGAAYAAVERLNQSIDQGDRTGRDFWAQVVQAIHEYQRTADGSQVRAGRTPRRRGTVRNLSLPGS
jgi:hypothetical protein